MTTNNYNKQTAVSDLQTQMSTSNTRNKQTAVSELTNQMWVTQICTINNQLCQI
jgi:hypothetical protein